jgi:hypothetical protein
MEVMTVGCRGSPYEWQCLIRAAHLLKIYFCSLEDTCPRARSLVKEDEILLFECVIEISGNVGGACINLVFALIT